MNFTRLAYDTPTYKQELHQSTGTGEYILETPWRSCKPCLSADSRQSSGVSTCNKPSMVDIDSELIGINRRATRDPAGQYAPSRTPYCGDATQVVDCDRAERSEDTRLSNPPNTLRSTGFNRWEWLCQNPQKRVEVPFDFMINSQLIVKDTHRPVLPTPFDPSAALPPDDEARIHSSAIFEPSRTLATNLPIVSWRSCEDIAKY